MDNCHEALLLSTADAAVQKQAAHANVRRWYEKGSFRLSRNGYQNAVSSPIFDQDDAMIALAAAGSQNRMEEKQPFPYPGLHSWAWHPRLCAVTYIAERRQHLIPTASTSNRTTQRLMQVFDTRIHEA
jgi:hypothetical protein